jgi:hypothetical protein
MYTIIKNKTNNNKIKYQITKQDNSKLTYDEFINLLKVKDENFLDFFKSELSGVQSDLGQTAYFWKCVPVSSNTLNKEFEFVAIKSQDLDNVSHDYSPFQEYFRGNKSVVSFPSRSGDMLVSPTPVRGHQYSCTDYDDEIRNYKNLREFNCEAPWEQWKELWQKVGEKMEEELLGGGNTTRWLNTHGLMVNHLHIRLDKSPKYYQGAEEYQVDDYQEQQQEIPPKGPSNPTNKWW